MLVYHGAVFYRTGIEIVQLTTGNVINYLRRENIGRLHIFLSVVLKVINFTNENVHDPAFH